MDMFFTKPKLVSIRSSKPVAKAAPKKLVAATKAPKPEVAKAPVPVKLPEPVIVKAPVPIKLPEPVVSKTHAPSRPSKKFTIKGAKAKPAPVSNDQSSNRNTIKLGNKKISIKA